MSNKMFNMILVTGTVIGVLAWCFGVGLLSIALGLSQEAGILFGLVLGGSAAIGAFWVVAGLWKSGW